MVALILRDRRHEQQCRERCCRQGREHNNGEIYPDTSEEHPDRIAQARCGKGLAMARKILIVLAVVLATLYVSPSSGVAQGRGGGHGGGWGGGGWHGGGWGGGGWHGGGWHGGGWGWHGNNWWWGIPAGIALGAALTYPYYGYGYAPYYPQYPYPYYGYGYGYGYPGYGYGYGAGYPTSGYGYSG